MGFANLGDRLKQALEYRGISQAKLANKLGFSRATITRYIKNDRAVKRSTLYEISKILDINPSWLILEEANMLEDIPQKVKSIDISEDNTINLTETVKIPVISTVPASFSKASDFIYDEYIEYPKSLLQYSDYDRRYISLKVDGDSMYPELFDKDSILVDILLDIKNGDIGVFYLNGDFTVKRIYLKEKSIIFKPSNPDYAEKEYTHRELHEMGYHKIGKVVKIIERKL